MNWHHLSGISLMFSSVSAVAVLSWACISRAGFGVWWLCTSSPLLGLQPPSGFLGCYLCVPSSSGSSHPIMKPKFLCLYIKRKMVFSKWWIWSHVSSGLLSGEQKDQHSKKQAWWCCLWPLAPAVSGREHWHPAEPGLMSAWDPCLVLLTWAHGPWSRRSGVPLLPGAESGPSVVCVSWDCPAQSQFPHCSGATVKDPGVAGLSLPWL